MNMNSRPELTLIKNPHPDKGKFEVSKKVIASAGAGTLAVGAAILALAGNPPKMEATPSASSPYTERQLDNMTTETFTFQPGQGEDAAIAAVDPKVLTTSEPLKREVESVIDQRLPEGHIFPEPHDQVAVPVIPKEQ